MKEKDWFPLCLGLLGLGAIAAGANGLVALGVAIMLYAHRIAGHE